VALASKRILHTLTRLLDITRLVRRIGRHKTGIDRVEWAYLQTLSAQPVPLWSIARTPLGYVLLDATGTAEIAHRFAQEDFARMDLLGRITPRRCHTQRRAEATLRRNARARCLPQGLGAMLRRHLPQNTRYLNVGHANLTDRMLRALHDRHAQITVLLHDVIPLDAPHWQRSGTTETFTRFFKRVEDHASYVIYSAHSTRRSCEAHFARPPPAVVAPLGLDDITPEPLPPHLSINDPYFVCLGTIEPRKNHALLLDIWQAWGGDAPWLILAGHRGWSNADVFARLDHGVPRVREAPGLTDGQVARLLDGSRGLLFPSHLEGFGFPPMEAAMRCVPVVAQPLPVLREIMGEIPRYVPAHDVRADAAALWQREIMDLSQTAQQPPPFDPPRWPAHFNAVLRVT